MIIIYSFVDFQIKSDVSAVSSVCIFCIVYRLLFLQCVYFILCIGCSFASVRILSCASVAVSAVCIFHIIYWLLFLQCVYFFCVSVAVSPVCVFCIVY